MADDERRAEIEAVTRLLVELHQRGVLTFSADADAIAAEILDRVRDARGDDGGHEGCERRGGVCDCAGRPCAVDYPDAARWERTAKATTAALVKAEDRIAELEAARPPQDEDHEAGDDLWEWTRADLIAQVRILRSCVSPSRDGTVAVEDVARWLQHVDRLDEIPGARIPLPTFNPLWDAAEALKREFASPASTGDRAPDENPPA